MRFPIVSTILAFVAGTLTSCSSAGHEYTNGQSAEQPTNNQELAKMYQQDQSSRQADSIDWELLTRRDSLRRVRVQELVDSNQVNTSADYYRAAMIFQHGNDSTDYHQAYKLARTAVKLDTTNESARWLTAATWDRYLLSTGRPQWYGTQYLTLDGTTYLRQIDTSRIDDESRKRYGVRTLDEIRSRLKKLNGEDQGLLQLPDSIRARINF